MGGYWALRATAHEPRIDRVVSWPPVYDWLLRVPAPLRPMTRAIIRRQGFMRWSIRARTRLVPTLAAVVDQPQSQGSGSASTGSAAGANDRRPAPVSLRCGTRAG